MFIKSSSDICFSTLEEMPLVTAPARVPPQLNANNASALPIFDAIVIPQPLKTWIRPSLARDCETAKKPGLAPVSDCRAISKERNEGVNRQARCLRAARDWKRRAKRRQGNRAKKRANLSSVHQGGTPRASERAIDDLPSLSRRQAQPVCAAADTEVRLCCSTPSRILELMEKSRVGSSLMKWTAAPFVCP
jgi:hypothetical protein